MRDGSGVYHIPPGTEGEPDTTIESAKYNAYIADIEQDLNAPRPINAGGTGATNADAALAAVGAEKANQVVTNYDSQLFVAGSFYSASTATGSPVSGRAFTGLAYMSDANNIMLEARDQDDTTVPSRKYIRQKKAGVWGAWAAEAFVPLAGGVMTGNIVITHPTAAVYVNKPASGTDVGFWGMMDNKNRWFIDVGNAVTESGSNAGSDFGIHRYDDAGSYIGQVLNINRSTGRANFANGLDVGAAFTVTGAIWSVGSPSVGTYVFGSSGTYSLTCDGSNYIFQGLPVTAVNGRLWGAADFSAPLPLAGGTMTGEIITKQSADVGSSASAGAIQVISNNNPAISFNKLGIFGANFGMDSAGNFYMGGWTHGTGITYQFWTKRDTAQIVTNTRLALAGDVTHNSNSAMNEPFAGAVVTGHNGIQTGSSITVRYRYLQIQFVPGAAWATVGYV